MKLRTTLLASAVLVWYGPPSRMRPQSRNFGISGPVTVNNVGVTVDQATSLTFTTVASYNGAPGSGVLGSLSPCIGNCGTGGTLVLTSMVAPYTYTATTPLFNITANGLSFDLTSITAETRVAAADNGGLALLRISGTILLHLAGYDNTVGTFTIQSNGAVGSAVFAASGIAATATPEPASLAILGGSLALLVWSVVAARSNRPDWLSAGSRISVLEPVSCKTCDTIGAQDRLILRR